MPRIKNIGVSKHEGINLPGFNYDVNAIFIPIEEPKTKHSRQAKGLLDGIDIRPSSGVTRGITKLRFYETHTYPTHSDLAHTIDKYPQPIVSLNWKGSAYSLAGRYTVRAGRTEPIEATMMIDSPNGDVREQNGYELLKSVASLSIVSAIFQATKDSERNTTPIELKIANNFASGGIPQFEDYLGRNIIDLASQLNR